jgi:hypothetical protein
MHPNRDSIRGESDQRSVSYAAIPYPGPSVTYGPGLAAIGTRPSNITLIEDLERILMNQLQWIAGPKNQSEVMVTKASLKWEQNEDTVPGKSPHRGPEIRLTTLAKLEPAQPTVRSVSEVRVAT